MIIPVTSGKFVQATGIFTGKTIQVLNKFKFIKLQRKLTEFVSTYLSTGRHLSGVAQTQLQNIRTVKLRVYNGQHLSMSLLRKQ
jgi:hypothetical protein